MNMDAPEQLRGAGTWQRYKLGQAQFTNWLKQTAEKVVSRNGGRPLPVPLSAKQKKAAASAAAAAAAAEYFGVASQPNVAAETEPDKPPPIHWSQLEVLAQRVVDNADPAEIPTAAVNILRDVVSLRKKSYGFFSKATKDSKDQNVRRSNSNHAHIINILEHVLAKLEGFLSSGRTDASNTPSKEPKDSTHVAVSDLTNMFTHLQVQEAEGGAGDSDGQSDDEQKAGETNKRLQKTSKKKAKAKKNSKPVKTTNRVSKTPTQSRPTRPWIDDVEFNLTPMENEYFDDEFDLYMMVYCFFVDFNAIRSHVAERWCDYWYDRSVSLTTLAVITNAAFELFHRMHSQLQSTLGQKSRDLASYDFMMGMLFFEFGIDHVDYNSYEGLTKEESDERIWRDEADWLAFPSYCTIKNVLDNMPPGKVPLMPPSQRSRPVYGPNNMESWRKFSQTVTMQLVGEAAHLKALKTNRQEHPILPAEPQFLQDLQMALLHRYPACPLIFSVHLWVDIRFIMEDQVVHSLEAAQRTASDFEQVFLSHDPGNVSGDRRFRELWRERVTEVKSHVLDDCQLDDKKARFRQSGVQEDPEEFFLLKNEPVWAGLLDFRVKLTRSELGHQYTALTSIVEAAGYMYHACLALDKTLPVWTEMARYIDTYTDQSPFKTVLNESPTPASIIRSFERVMKAHQAAVKEWDNPSSTDTTFVPDVAIRRSLYRRYAWEDPTDKGSMRYLQELTIHRLRIERSDRKERAHDLPRKATTAGEAVRNGDGKSKGRVKAPSQEEGQPLEADRAFKRRAMLTQLSHIEMLQLLDETVTSQLEGLLTLDYFRLFDEAVDFLKAIVEGFGPELRGRVGFDDETRPGCLGLLPVHLVRNLDEDEDGVVGALVEICRGFLGGLEREVLAI